MLAYSVRGKTSYYFLAMSSNVGLFLPSEGLGKGRKGILFIVHLNRKDFSGKLSLYLSPHANHPVSYLGIPGNLDKFKV